MHGLRLWLGWVMAWGKSRGKAPAMTDEERAALDARAREERRARLMEAAKAVTCEARRWLVVRRAFDPAESVPVQMRQLARFRTALAHGQEAVQEPAQEVCIDW